MKLRRIELLCRFFGFDDLLVGRKSTSCSCSDSSSSVDQCCALACLDGLVGEDDVLFGVEVDCCLLRLRGRLGLDVAVDLDVGIQYWTAISVSERRVGEPKVERVSPTFLSFTRHSSSTMQLCIACSATLDSSHTAPTNSEKPAFPTSFICGHSVCPNCTSRRRNLAKVSPIPPILLTTELTPSIIHSPVSCANRFTKFSLPPPLQLRTLPLDPL